MKTATRNIKSPRKSAKLNRQDQPDLATKVEKIRRLAAVAAASEILDAGTPSGLCISWEEIDPQIDEDSSRLDFHLLDEGFGSLEFFVTKDASAEQVVTAFVRELIRMRDMLQRSIEGIEQACPAVKLRRQVSTKQSAKRPTRRRNQKQPA